MQLEHLRPQRNIDNNDKVSDEIQHINMIDDRIYYERYHIGENKEETLNTDIEALKLRKFSSQKNIDYLQKEYYERNHMDMSGDKESDERDRRSEND